MLRYLLVLVVILKLAKIWAAHVKSRERHIGKCAGESSQEDGLAATPGRAGEFMWAGAAGTFFWVDPKEQLVGLLMTQAPGPSRVYYRKLFKQLVYQAIADELSPAMSASR